MTDNNNLNERFKGNTAQGLTQVYDTSSFGNEDGGDYVAIAVGKYIKAFDDKGIFIGSSELVPQHYEELDPTNKNTSVGSQECSLENLCVPVINVPKATRDIGGANEDKESFTYKTIEEINKIANEVDNLPEAQQIISILSEDYKNLPIQIISQLSPEILKLMAKYERENKPEERKDYEDLSSFKSADFPKLSELDQNTKENSELLQ